jgi:flagellar basal body P-ring protein FlgI
MYGKAFCVLIIVLILIYNLATGSVETVASSSNESLTSWATYGTLVQAGAAVITLGIMIWLGIRQNAMTRRQLNLSLYEKRYKIYREIEDTLEKEFLFLKFPNQEGANAKHINFQEYVDPLYKKINNLKSSTRERTFLLDADVNEIIDKTFQIVINIVTNIAEIYFSREYDSDEKARGISQYNDANSERNKIIPLMDTIHKYFENVLDFKEI